MNRRFVTQACPRYLAVPQPIALDGHADYLTIRDATKRIEYEKLQFGMPVRVIVDFALGRAFFADEESGDVQWHYYEPSDEELDFAVRTFTEGADR